MAAKQVHKGAHKLQRVRQTNRVIYRCMLPDCTTFYVKELVLGKKCVCHRCGEEFIIEKNHMHLKKMHCSNCTKHREEADII